MKDKKMLLNQLISNRLMSSDEEIELYEEAVDNLFNEEDINVIDLLIQGFLDETENEEVMFSTLHGIEFFSKKKGLKEYINKIIPLLKTIEEDAYGWSETLFLRLLNNEEAFAILLDELKSFKSIDIQYITKLAKGLIKKNPKKFEEKGSKILKRIESNDIPIIYKTYEGKDYSKEEWEKFEEEEYKKYVEKRNKKRSSFLADEETESKNFSAESGTLKEVQYFVMDKKGEVVQIYQYPSTMSKIVATLQNGTAIDVLEYKKDDWSEVLSKDGKKGYIYSSYIVKNH